MVFNSVCNIMDFRGISNRVEQSFTNWHKSYCAIISLFIHYRDVIIGAMASQVTSLAIVYSTVYSDKHQSPASLILVCGIHRWSVNSPHKGLVKRQMFSFDDVTMAKWENVIQSSLIYICFPQTKSHSISQHPHFPSGIVNVRILCKASRVYR